jgi:hypothetical protein
MCRRELYVAYSHAKPRHQIYTVSEERLVHAHEYTPGKPGAFSLTGASDHSFPKTSG